MKTLLKRTTLLFLLVIATVCLGLFAACGDDDGNKNPETLTYTVTVNDENDAPVKDVKLNFNKGSAFYPATTGADGKATVELAPDSYTVTITKLPDGYSAPENITVTKDNPSTTIKLVKDFRYVVNLVDEDGKPFYRPGVQLALCYKNGSNCLMGSLLGEDGKWSSSADPDDYKVQILFSDELEGQFTFTGSSEGHYYTGEYFSATKTEITIVISSANAATAYTVTVLNPDGTPAQNVYATLSTGTSSLAPVRTDANGKAKITVSKYGEYSVTINAPDGCVYDSGIKTNADNHEITVQLYTLNTLNPATEMTADEIRAYGLNANAFPAYYSFTENFKANETRYFALAAYKSGEYAIYCTSSGVQFKVCTEGTNFTDAEDYPVGSTMATAISGVKGKIVYFSIKANAATQLQFVVAGPDRSDTSSTEATFNGVGTKSITVESAVKYATVNFAPTQTGIYEITSEGNFDTKIECYANNGIKFDEDDDSGEGNNFKYTITVEQVATSTATYRIYVKSGATFPATFNVKITRIGDLNENKDPEQETVEATQAGNEPYAGTGAFEYADLSVLQTVALGTDGYYHLDTADGPVLVAKLNKNFRNFGVFTTENPNAGGKAATPYFVQFRTYDNSGKLTGDYNYINFLNAYKDVCNFDGVYPVTAEIKLMLERWASFNINEYTFGIESLGTIAKGNEWLIPCGYYVSSTLSGTGAEDDAYMLETGSYEISLAADTDVFFMSSFDLNGKYTVTVITDKVLVFASTVPAPIEVSEIEGGYTFDCEISMAMSLGFKIKASEAVTVVIHLDEKVSENVLELGDTDITVNATDYFDGVTYTFTAEESGWYVISSDNDNASLYATDEMDEEINHVFTGSESGESILNGPFTYKFYAEAGVEYTLLFGSVDFNGGTYTVTVEETTED